MGFVEKVLRAIGNRRPIYVSNQYADPQKEFLGKTAVVFGGGSGIGRAIAEELYKCGADVIVCGRKELTNDDMQFFQIDVSDCDHMKQKLDNLIGKNTIDMIVNSQGICPYRDFKGDFLSIDHEDFDSVFGVNTKSVFFICQYFINYFIRNNRAGHILNICSTEGLKGTIVPYGMSKAATISLTKGLGKRMVSEGIVINGIAPGATATDMMHMEMGGDLRKNYIPSQRACTPMEIAKVAHLLLSDLGNQMCGEVIVIDGGESLH